MMARRSFFGGLAALGGGGLLAGCGGDRQKAAVRYRVIATVEVDGKRVEGSSVMEVDYSRVENSLVGNGGSTRLYGEALILDLKGRGTVYVLPEEYNKDGGLRQIYEFGILKTLGIKNSIGGLKNEDFETLRNAKGRRPFSMGPLNPPTRLPAFAAFRDEKIPRTIYQVDPQNMGRSFPGVRFISLDIEITNAPVTKVLKQRLPWLVSSFQNPGFDRDPPGHLRPEKDTPFSYMIDYNSFFGDGSQ